MSENIKQPDKPVLPKRGDYEPKSDNYLEPHEEGKPRTGKQSGKYPRSQVVCLASKNRRLANPQPDIQEPCITGRYQEVHGKFTFLINQAGTHIECWKSEELDDQHGRRKVAQALGGDHDGTKYTLYTSGKPEDLKGTLDFSNINRPVWNDGKTESSLDLRFERATFSEQAIERLGGTGLLRAYEHLPLTEQQLRWLNKDALEEQKINQYIRDYFDRSFFDFLRTDKIRIENIAKYIDEYIGNTFRDKVYFWNEEVLFLFYARHILFNRKLEIKEMNRSQLFWFQRMVNDTTSAPFMGNSRKYLGLVTTNASFNFNKDLYKYTFTIRVVGFESDAKLWYDIFKKKPKLPEGVQPVVGNWKARKAAKALVGIGAGHFTGKLQVSRYGWSKEFDVWFGRLSIGLGLSVEIGTELTGTAETYDDWTEEDFLGWIASFDAVTGLHGKIGSHGMSPILSFTHMKIFGSGIHEPMWVNFSGLTDIKGLGFTPADIGIFGGKIFKSDSSPLRKTDWSYFLPDTYDYTSYLDLKEKIHFRRGDALLTKEGRQALRVVAAKELACFMSEGSCLVLDAHADRVDCAERNLELSDLRAKNVKQALKDILGDQLKIPDDQIVTRGHGERYAADAGDKDGQDNPNWRRVDVILDHRLVLRMTGQ